MTKDVISKSTAMVRVKKNYRPLTSSSILAKDVTVGKLLATHEKLREMGALSASGGELVGPWYVYKEGSDKATDSLTKEHVKVFVDTGIINKDALLAELINVGEQFSGPSLAAGGELIGPWYVLREGTNALEVIGDIADF